MRVISQPGSKEQLRVATADIPPHVNLRRPLTLGQAGEQLALVGPDTKEERLLMPIVLHLEMPEVSIDNYDAVSDRVGLDDDPPQGLILHSSAEMEGGGVRIVDVWESKEDLDRFEQERVMPAIREGELGGPPGRREIIETHHLRRSGRLSGTFTARAA